MIQNIYQTGNDCEIKESTLVTSVGDIFCELESLLGSALKHRNLAERQSICPPADVRPGANARAGGIPILLLMMLPPLYGGDGGAMTGHPARIPLSRREDL